MLTFALLATDAAQPSGQLWRPLLIFGVIAGLMALVVLLQVTDPRRRSRGVTDPAVALTPDGSPSTPATADSEAAVDGSPALVEDRAADRKEADPGGHPMSTNVVPPSSER